MNAWTHRAYTRDECAVLCGMPRGSLDVLTHRARDVSVLFTEKRGTKRWFSVKDICVLRIAHELERAGRSWLMAIGAAFDNLQHPPPADALLIAPAVIRRGCGLPRIISDRDVPRLNFERSEIIVPIGLICQTIVKEAENVAVEK
ncbi:hypothetical protein [Mesorhizobium sp. AA22]|uniref:hypothetical protein n=1 Tax=Mesorhizobium sp. AA22 TaxID=1854057 RepID=UPI0007ED9475|nr:hypothetical protein [Mesorhizobium sp. AA22]QIA23104.1 hypothetical protein A9K68_015975 [Mesorhizobium sp. AA22]